MASMFVANKIGQRGLKGIGIVGRDENGRAVPVFAQARNIAHDQRASREGRLEDRQPKRLVARGQSIDGGTRELGREIGLAQAAKQLEVAWTVMRPAWVRGI